MTRNGHSFLHYFYALMQNPYNSHQYSDSIIFINKIILGYWHKKVDLIPVYFELCTKLFCEHRTEIYYLSTVSSKWRGHTLHNFFFTFQLFPLLINNFLFLALTFVLLIKWHVFLICFNYDWMWMTPIMGRTSLCHYVKISPDTHPAFFSSVSGAFSLGNEASLWSWPGIKMCGVIPSLMA